MEIGDRIIYKSQKGVIIGKASTSLPKRYLIKLSNQYNVSGTEVKIWISIDDISIDKAYYRDIKIKSLLND